jgi:hypothetical protein
MDITVDNPTTGKSIRIIASFEDLMEYKKYRDREMHLKKRWPEITVLSPVQWYEVHKPHIIQRS